MFFGPTRDDARFYTGSRIKEFGCQVSKVLGHEGAWYGVPRIPDGYRDLPGLYWSADDLARVIAKRIAGDNYDVFEENGYPKKIRRLNNGVSYKMSENFRVKMFGKL